MCLTSASEVPAAATATAERSEAGRSVAAAVAPAAAPRNLRRLKPLLAGAVLSGALLSEALLSGLADTWGSLLVGSSCGRVKVNARVQR